MALRTWGVEPTAETCRFCSPWETAVCQLTTIEVEARDCFMGNSHKLVTVNLCYKAPRVHLLLPMPVSQVSVCKPHRHVHKHACDAINIDLQGRDFLRMGKIQNL